MFKKAFNYIFRRRQRRNKRGEEETDRSTMAISNRSQRPQRLQRLQRSRTPRRTPIVTPSASSSATSSTHSTKTSGTPMTSSPDSSSSTPRRSSLLHVKSPERHSALVTGMAGSFSAAQRQKLAVPPNTFAEQQIHTTTEKKLSPEEDVGKEEEDERRHKAMLEMAEITQEVSKKTASRKKFPDRSKRVTASRRATRNMMNPRSLKQVRDGSRKIISQKDVNRKEQGIARVDPFELNQVKCSTPVRSYKGVRRRGMQEQGETRMTTRNVTIPEIYRKKIKKVALTESTEPNPPPPLPSPQEDSDSEVTDYWLYPEGRHNKNVETAFIPSDNDVALQKVTLPQQEMCVPPAPRPVVEVPKFVQQAYGVLDRPPAHKPAVLDPSRKRAKTAQFKYPHQTCDNGATQDETGGIVDTQDVAQARMQYHF